MHLMPLKKILKSENYIENLIEKRILFLNQHRLNYSLIPDTEFNKKNEEKIQQKVIEKTRDLSQKDKEDIVRLANELESRQNAHDDPEILPKVTKDDIPLSRTYASPVISSNQCKF